MCKKREHVQSCCFTNINLLLLTFSLPSPSLLPKLPFVVIQKFCYHGNVTSRFSSLLPQNFHLLKTSLQLVQIALGNNDKRKFWRCREKNRVFITVAETIVIRFCVVMLVLMSVFSTFCVTSFGDCTRPQHGESTNKSLNKSAMIALTLYMWNRSITVKINNAGGRHCTKRLGDLKLRNYLPVTEGKKIAKRIKNEVVTSDLTSPSYAPASIPGETSSFFRYLLFQLSTSNENELL